MTRRRSGVTRYNLGLRVRSVYLAGVRYLIVCTCMLVVTSRYRELDVDA